VRLLQARPETFGLLLLADVQEELQQDDIIRHEHLFEIDNLSVSL